MAILGTTRTYNIGDRTSITGPNGRLVDGLLRCVILRESTYEEWISQLPPPANARTKEHYKDCRFYEVSVD